MKTVSRFIAFTLMLTAMAFVVVVIVT
jgi:hypothetical protein